MRIILRELTKFILAAIGQVFLDWVGFRFLDEALRMIQSPTTASSLSGVIGILAIGLAFVLGYYIVSHAYKWVKMAKHAMQTMSAEPEPTAKAKSDVSEPVLDERFMPNLVALARMKYKEMLRDNLRLVGQELDRKTSPRIITWDAADPEFKKYLITDEVQYDALKDFAKSLGQRRDNLGKPDFDVYDNLCKVQYERLKRLGLA
jgi:hypothetical protein